MARSIARPRRNSRAIDRQPILDGLLFRRGDNDLQTNSSPDVWNRDRGRSPGDSMRTFVCATGGDSRPSRGAERRHGRDALRRQDQYRGQELKAGTDDVARASAGRERPVDGPVETGASGRAMGCCPSQTGELDSDNVGWPRPCGGALAGGLAGRHVRELSAARLQSLESRDRQVRRRRQARFSRRQGARQYDRNKLRHVPSRRR